LLAHPPGRYEPWSPTEELLAQLIEEVSIVASERRRKAPREVHRPGTPRRPSAPTPAAAAAAANPNGAGTAVGHLAVARAFADRGRVRVGGR